MIRVVLSNPDPDYHIGKGNPKANTPYQCEGTVSRVDGLPTSYHYEENTSNIASAIAAIKNEYPGRQYGAFSIHVDWDNDHSNTYKPGELSILNDKTPKCVSIW